MQLASSRIADEIQDFNYLLRKSSFEGVTDFALKVTEFLANKLHYVKSVFYVFSDDIHAFKASSFYGCDLQQFEKFYVQNKQGLVGQAAYSQKVMYFENVYNSSIAIDFSSFKLSVISIYVYPIVFNNVCYGVIEMIFPKPLSNETKNFFLLIRDNFGATLESILTHERTHKLLQKTYQQKNQIEEAYQNISVISNIGQKITSILELDKLTKALYFELENVLDFSAIAIATFKEETRSFNFETGLIDGELYNLGKFIVGYDELIDSLYHNHVEVGIDDIESYSDKIGDIPLFNKKINERDFVMQSAMFFPLIIDNKIKGMLTVQSFKKYAFSENHKIIIKMLAAYIAIAIENILAYRLIQIKNKAITDSILYAQKMQQAILPKHDDFKEVFSDTFEVFLPKDIVSGDFFWFGKVSHYYFVALVDCTGHGVPGAFMSMIGDSLLNQIILEKQITDPSNILTYLDIKIRKSLKQQETKGYDGMEVLLCRFKRSSNEGFDVMFSGTKPKLYYTYNGELRYLKGDKKNIGGQYPFDDKVFRNQKISLKRGENLYMTTDGILDVCNKRRKKYSAARLEEKLRLFQNHPMTTQRELILKDMKAFQEGVAQRDDITLLGIKL